MQRGYELANTGTTATALVGFIPCTAVVGAWRMPLPVFAGICAGLVDSLRDWDEWIADNWTSGNRDLQLHGTAVTELWGNEVRHLLDTPREVGPKRNFRAMCELLECISASGDSHKDISVLFDTLSNAVKKWNPQANAWCGLETARAPV